MKTVHRYSFKPSERFVIRLPKTAEVLHVGLFGCQPTVWALAEEEAEREERVFHIATDDKPIDPAAVTYVGTIEFENSTLHIFSAR